MAVRAPWLLLCLLGCAAKSRGEPIVSTDLVYSTYGLLSEACSAAYDKAGVDGLLAKLPWDEAGKMWAKVPPEVQQTLGELSVKTIQVKATVQTAIGSAREPLEQAADSLVAKVVTIAPAMDGRIGKGLGNLVIFVLYACVVGFVFLKAARLALWVFCCICCCGCCGRSKPKPESDQPKAKGKAKKK